MTTKPTKAPTAPPLPDPPQREPEDMTAFNHLAATGNTRYLMLHFGNPETTLVAGEHYITPDLTGDLTGRHYPDLFIAFGVDPEAYRRSNAYIIPEQGKPPDFVLEIASRSTADVDITDKRRNYAALGIPEYWRFDETGRFHGTRLAGDRLVDGKYQRVAIETLDDGSLQGYSEVLNLNLRWEASQLGWYNPTTNRHIATFEDERQGRLEEQQGRLAAEARASTEQETRIAAESRVRELEAELARRNQDQ